MRCKSDLFFTIVISLSLSSCASYVKIHTKSAPAWVNALRDGTQTVKVIDANNILYRANFKDPQNKLGPNDSCEKAILKAEDYIRKDYPFLDQFPYSVDYVFYDPNAMDCTTTVSITKEFSSKMELLKLYKGSQEKVIKEIQDRLSDEKAKNKGLTAKVNQLETFIKKNSSLRNELKRLEGISGKISARIRTDEERVAKFAITGATKEEIERVLNKEIVFDIKVSGQCHNKFKTNWVSYHGRHTLCWNDSSMLRGACSESECWTISPEGEKRFE